jgi:uncharacterized protein (DUF1810 family)
MSGRDPLQRFVDAQESVYPDVRRELQRGRKTSHWMWFIFPQIAGLGRSATAQQFAIASLDKAKTYLAHPLLGPRLRECVALVNAVEGSSARQIFGQPDDLKFASSMTLFAHATADNAVFLEALRKYCGSRHDPLTLDRL